MKKSFRRLAPCFLFIIGVLQYATMNSLFKRSIISIQNIPEISRTENVEREKEYNQPEDYWTDRNIREVPVLKKIGNIPGNLTYLIGIPTVARSQDTYIYDTLDSIFRGFDLAKPNNITAGVLVFTGGADHIYYNDLKDQFEKRFPDRINSSELFLYCGSADYYPDWLNNGTGKTDQLVPTFSDPMDRMIWRTRQSLDYMYLWSIATQKAKYFLQLEDDVTAVSKFLNFIDLQVEKRKSENWISMEFSKLGFIGKLFESDWLDQLVTYSSLFYRDKPIDWIYWSFINMKACSPEFDKKNCDLAKNKISIPIIPAQFLHIGQFSSLDGKVQKLQDATNRQNPALSFVGTNKFYDVAKIKLLYSVYSTANTVKLARQANLEVDRSIEFIFVHPQAPGIYEFESGITELIAKDKLSLPSKTQLWARIENSLEWILIDEIGKCSKIAKDKGYACDIQKLYKEKIQRISGFKLVIPKIFDDDIYLRKIWIH